MGAHANREQTLLTEHSADKRAGDLLLPSGKHHHTMTALPASQQLAPALFV